MGKPLISDAQMLSMHRVMVRLREMQPLKTVTKRKGSSASAWPEAVLAASLLQLGTEDVLVTEGERRSADTVLALAGELSFQRQSLPFTVRGAERSSVAALAAGYALAQNHYSHPGDSAPVTLALLQAGTPVGEAVRLAGQHLLPLLLLVREEPDRPRLPMVAPDNVEVIQIDAEDAVAVCRVMQESMVRARNRWGSVVLRAVTLPNSPDPIAALEAHLLRRGILNQRLETTHREE